MHVGHGNEAALFQRAASSLSILKFHGAQEHAAPKIKFLPVRQYRDASFIEPLAVRDAELEREPVGQIHEVFVLDHATGDIGLEPVVPAGKVSPRIMDAVCDCSGRGPARGEVAVT